MDKVLLRNIRGIKNLEFKIPPPGTWLLTGPNGSGKTSLFAALYRIRFGNAFQKFFRTNGLGSRVDSYSTAEIEYVKGEQSVKYRYGGQRWRANPRKLSRLLDQSRYPTVIFVEASGERVDPYPEEIVARRLKDAAEETRQFMSSVLGNQKWAELKYVNTRRGRNSIAFLLPFREGRGTKYFSEKSFSLGELCVLKLAKKFEGIAEGSLVLVDEIEMALHPQAQVRLLEAVRRIGESKRLTIIFSTHSSTLIRSAPRRNLIFLNMLDGGAVEPLFGAYPASILGEMAFDDELAVDFLFFVEDEEARAMLEQMLFLYFQEIEASTNSRPQFRVLPVGGFVQVVRMLDNSRAVFPTYVKRTAFLDEDARPHVPRRPDVYYLPCTPEKGVVDLLESWLAQNREALRSLNSCIPGLTLHLDRYMEQEEYNNFCSPNLRDRAKKRMEFLVSKMSDAAGCPEFFARSKLYEAYCREKYGEGGIDIRPILGPILNR